MRAWWKLTEEEVARLNPPMDIVVIGDDGNFYKLDQHNPDWLSVGEIPMPRTRLGWIVYHIIHGLAMRYPWWKVIGFAFASKWPIEEVDLSGLREEYEGYLRWCYVEGHGGEPMLFDEYIKWAGSGKGD